MEKKTAVTYLDSRPIKMQESATPIKTHKIDVVGEAEKSGSCAPRELETLRCVRFIVQQINKGIPTEDALTQARQMYGFLTFYLAEYYIAKSIYK